MERRLGRNAGIIASLVAGDGKVYAASENGTVYVLEHGPELKNGVTSGTITNWILIEKVIPDMQKAIDAGELTVHSTRGFSALSQKGQEVIWENHDDVVFNLSGGRLHKWIRQNYPPSEFPKYYIDPEKIDALLNRQGREKNRKGKKRAVIGRDRKKGMLSDFKVKKVEIDEKKNQIQELEKEIVASIPVIEAILEDSELCRLLPDGMENDFQEFAERYI